MSQAVKLSDALVLDARLAGNAVERSIAGQVEFWARLGRSIDDLQDPFRRVQSSNPAHSLVPPNPYPNGSARTCRKSDWPQEPLLGLHHYFLRPQCLQLGLERPKPPFQLPLLRRPHTPRQKARAGRARLLRTRPLLATNSSHPRKTNRIGP